MRLFFRVFGFVFLAAALLAAYNFFTVANLTEPRARAAACAGRKGKCEPAMTRLARTPLWQDVTFRIGKDTVVVRCARSAYLVGDYACAVRPGP